MAPRFGEVALRAAHLAAALLGWRPAEFWDATPAELITALGLRDAPPTGPADSSLLNGLMERYPDAC
jgi:hypothetical protein